MRKLSLLIALATLLTPTTNSADAPPADTVLSVSQVLSSQDQYVGQKISLRGNLRIVPSYSMLPCPSGVQPCNPIISVAVFLQDLNDPTKQIVIYQGADPYKCSYDMQGNYQCPPFVNNTVTVLEGIYSKGKQPGTVTGTASPAGGPTPPQASTLTNFYYLDVASSSGTPRIVGRPVTRKPRK
jgi:hypothetical protein